jgi:hypothetical protein
MLLRIELHLVCPDISNCFYLPLRGSTAQNCEKSSSTVPSSLIQIISYLGTCALIMLYTVENVSRSKPE